MRRLLLMSLILALPFAAAQSVRIEAWYSLGEAFGGPFFEQLAQEFSDLHADIEVVPVYAGNYENSIQRLQAVIAVGEGPAIFHMAHVLGAPIVEGGFVVPLDGFIAETPGFDVGDFYDALLDGCRYDGTIYCVPFNTSTPVLYYNKDAFRAAGLDPVADFPTTWDALFEVGPQISAVNERGELEQWAYAVPATGWHFDAFLGQAGGTFVNEDYTEWVFNDEHGLRVVNFWVDLVEQNIAAVAPHATQTEEFFNERQVIRMESTAQLENFFRQAQFDLGVAPLWCDAECYAPIGGGSLYLMDFGTEAEQQAAWQFLHWMAEPEQSARFVAATGYFAPRASTYDNQVLIDYLETRPEAQVAIDQMATIAGPERERVPYINEVRTAYATAFDEVLRAGVDPQRALDGAVREANRLLQVYAD